VTVLEIVNGAKVVQADRVVVAAALGPLEMTDVDIHLLASRATGDKNEKP
jgi:hypothetical protein